jgi:hypothetical protein
MPHPRAGLGWLLLVCLLPSLSAFAAEAPAPTLVLPLGRTAYIQGESVPLVVTGVSGPLQLALVDAHDRAVPLFAGPGGPVLVDTTWLATGTYRVQANQTLLSPGLTIASPLRTSPMGLPDESYTNNKPNLRQALAETGITAVMMPAFTEHTGGPTGPRRAELDDYVPTGTMLYLNPTTRPSSFFPARGGKDEVEGIRHRYALYAQANARYPTFGGFWYDWDAGGIFGMQGLMLYFGLGKREEAFRAFAARRDEAVYAEFRRRTGMEPVSAQEFLRYSLATGHPEFAQNIDYVAFKINRDLAKNLPKMAAAELHTFERRLVAWNDYVMGVYADAYAGHQHFLRTVMPSLRNTSSQNIDHNTVRNGHWHPASNAALDFRYMSTWNDQVGSPDYPDQWLITAGVLDIGRPAGQPVWLASTLAMAHGQAPYPGKFQRMAGHILGYGGTGLGNACEGFSTLLSSMDGRSLWPKLKEDPAGMNDLIGGREFLTRFAALAQQCADYRKVAVLYSQRQFGVQDTSAVFGSSTFQTFTTLAHLGYHPRFVTEAMLEANALRDYQALVITNQTAALPAATLQQLQAFTQRGGRVFLDDQSTISLAGAQQMPVRIPFAYLGMPHNWAVTNDGGKGAQGLLLERLAEFGPGFYAALGDRLRTPLMSANGAATRMSTFALDGGPDARYIIAVNDAPAENQARWARYTERLVPNGETTGALYDLTKETALGPVAPVDCVFDDVTARLYGVLARPVSRVDVRASQRLRGGELLRVAVGFRDAHNTLLRASIPFSLTVLQPDGTAAATFYRATDRAGAFAMAWPVPANATAGSWTVRVHSLLDGMTTDLPVRVQTGGRIAVTPIREAVIARGREQIDTLLQQKPGFVIPVFDGPSFDERLAVAESVRTTFAKQGISAEVRPRPAMTTYTVSYNPTPEQTRENARARAGEAFGKIVQDIDGYINCYEACEGDYIFGKPVILLDLAGLVNDKGKPLSDNPLAERLEKIGTVWPQVTAAFPGPGKATVQIVKSAFNYGLDALIIQAVDCAGLQAGASALTHLPADWANPSVAHARETLLAQFGIGTAPAPIIKTKGLTAAGARASLQPQPLALLFGTILPPTVAEVKPSVPAVQQAQAVPGTFKPQQLLAQYLLDGKFVETVQPLKGDCRFFDGLSLKVAVPEASPYTFAVEGVFRYADREPESQGSWDAQMALWNALPKKREPMALHVYVDGALAGSLTTLTTAQRTVSLYMGSSRKADEEVVVTISGPLSLPAGEHTIVFVPRHMVDGKIGSLSVTR